MTAADFGYFDARRFADIPRTLPGDRYQGELPRIFGATVQLGDSGHRRLRNCCRHGAAASLLL